MAQYYDKYKDFRFNNQVRVLPFVKITKRPTDIKIAYKKDRTRLDIVSNTYYGAPYYGWLILSANPQYGGLEFDIPDNAQLTIPFPLLNALQDYQNAINNYNVLYKIDDAI